jgi:hypothetical protein
MNALSTIFAARRQAACLTILAATIAAAVVWADPPAPGPQAGAAERTMPSQATPEDAARKVEIMSGPRWRRAIFELGEWLSSQQI